MLRTYITIQGLVADSKIDLLFRNQWISKSPITGRWRLTDDDKLLSDLRLMHAVAAGDERAKWQLFTLLWRRMCTLARHMCFYRQEVEDVAQEIMLQIFESAHRYRGEGCVEAWAKSIGMRTVFKHLRRTARRRSVFVDSPVLVEGGSCEANLIEQQVSSRMNREKLYGFLNRLPAKERAAIVLKLVEGHSVREVAQILGKKEDQVCYLLKKARKKLTRWIDSDSSLRELLWRNQ